MNGLTLEDEFGPRWADLSKLSRLCSRVDTSGGKRGSEDPGHLMCYETQPSKLSPRLTAVEPIAVANQFGWQGLTPTTPSDLCVPALATRPAP